MARALRAPPPPLSDSERKGTYIWLRHVGGLWYDLSGLQSEGERDARQEGTLEALVITAGVPRQSWAISCPTSMTCRCSTYVSSMNVGIVMAAFGEGKEKRSE